MSIFRQSITLIADGQPVNAAVTNTPLSQLLNNDLYMLGLLSTAASGAAIYDLNAGMSSSVVAGTPVFFNSATSRYEPAQAGSTPAAAVMGICATVLSPTSGNILLYGKSTVDLTTVVGGSPVIGPYYLSNTAGLLTATKTNAAILVLISGPSQTVWVMPQYGPSNASGYTFTQASPSSTWAITHNLGKFPSVSVVDNSGNLTQGSVVYNNANSVTISFTSAFAGVAYLN